MTDTMTRIRPAIIKKLGWMVQELAALPEDLWSDSVYPMTSLEMEMKDTGEKFTLVVGITGLPSPTAEIERLQKELAQLYEDFDRRIGVIGQAATDFGLCTGCEAKPPESFLIDEFQRLRAKLEEAKRLRKLLAEAAQYVSDAGNDEDLETRRLSAQLLQAIHDAIGVYGGVLP